MSVLLTLHVVTAVLLMGAVMYATSAFPNAAVHAANGDAGSEGIARATHRVSELYGYISLLVPLLGVTILFTNWSTYSDQYQFHAAILLAAVAWILLLAVIVPKQKKMVGALGLLAPGEEEPEDRGADTTKLKKQLSMFSGIFNLLWVITLVLMFV